MVTLYDQEPPDSYVVSLQDIGAALMLLVGAAAWIYVARVCRRPV